MSAVETTNAEKSQTLEFLGTVAAAYKSGGIELEALLEVIGGAFEAALAGDRAVFAYMRSVIQQDQDQAQADTDAAADGKAPGANSFPQQYEVQPHENGTWLVLDTRTGHPGQINGYSMMRMAQGDAIMASSVLNRLRLRP